MRYSISWRKRLLIADGRTQELTVVREATDPERLKALGARFAHEAVDREFLLTLTQDGTGGQELTLCVRAEELAAWPPVEGDLPRGIVPTRWILEERAAAHRYRIYAVIVAAMDEARRLRIVGRNDSRNVLAGLRQLLLSG